MNGLRRKETYRGKEGEGEEIEKWDVRSPGLRSTAHVNYPIREIDSFGLPGFSDWLSSRHSNLGTGGDSGDDDHLLSFVLLLFPYNNYKIAIQ